MRSLSAVLAALLLLVTTTNGAVSPQEACSIELLSVQPEPSDCRGNYVLRIKPWFGRTGNNLFSLANVIHLASQTHSEVIVPQHPLLKQTEWDFREESEKARELNITIRGAGSLGRQQIFSDDFYHEDEMPIRIPNWDFGTTKQREVLINHVLPALHITPYHARDAVVVHIRSGDVFSSEVIHPYYGQPPFAFYKSVLQLPELAGREVVLCVEDHLNPVIDLIAAEFPDRIRFVTDLREGIAHILGASHFVLARSTFSQNLGKMAPFLKAAYFPFCIEEDTIDKRDLSYDRTWSMPGYCYTYDDDYIPVTNWSRSPEQLQMMATYSIDKVHAHALPIAVHATAAVAS